MKSNVLKNWIIEDKFTIGLSLFCAFVPALVGLIIKSFRPHDLNIDMSLYLYIGNILFIFITLLLLVNSNFLINGKKRSSELLYEYVQKELNSDSELFAQGADVLFKRMDISIKQFYYSWIIIWTIWLIMYLGKLIFFIYKSYMVIVPDEMFRLSCLFENFMNLANSFTMFFIYMVMTISTVKVSAASRNRGQFHIAVILLIFLGMGCFLVDSYSIYVMEYAAVQFYIRVFIGIVATISFMAVLGRLNSSYLDIPQGIIMCLYLYASLQMFYPFIYSDDDYINGILSVVNVKSLNLFFYIISFSGKILLFMVIRWIIKENRFLFFIIRKADNMDQSNDMLKTFNRIYGQNHKEK
jgi:hypothetical protein